MHDAQTIQLVLTAVAACALVLQTIFMIVIAVIALKAIKAIRQELDEYRSAVIPVIDNVKPIVEKTRTVVDKIAPRLEDASIQLAAISKSLRVQTNDIQVAADEIIERTRRQANRIDGIMTSVLNKVEQAGAVVADAVAKPMRQFSGLIASVKAVVETLRDQGPAAPRASRAVPPRYPDDEPGPGARTTSAATSFRP